MSSLDTDAGPSFRPSVDARTRSVGVHERVVPATFWATDWTAAIKRHGERASSDAARLDLDALTLRIDGAEWTLRIRDGEMDTSAIAARGYGHGAGTLDFDALEPLVLPALGATPGATPGAAPRAAPGAPR